MAERTPASPGVRTLRNLDDSDAVLLSLLGGPGFAQLVGELR